MPRTPCRSLPWMVLVVVAVTATLVGVSSASTEQTCYDVSDPVEETALAPDALSEPPTVAGADLETRPAAGRLAGLEPTRPDVLTGFALTPAGLFEDSAAEALQLAALDSSADSAQRTEVALRAREEVDEYDPWQPFNEGMFSFNRQLDRFAVKPVATVWDAILPDQVQRSLGRAFDNLGMPRRLVNSLLQLKVIGAGRELTRFLLNTTIGIAGFFDVAKALGIEKSDEDTGQTLGVYGVGSGPYLVLPFLPPVTIRDGIGTVFDLAMDPLNYFLPFAALAGMKGGNVVNDRSLNLEFYQNVEETVLDLYSAVRNGYLQRRAKQIRE